MKSTINHSIKTLLAITIVVCGVNSNSFADPCGMVPPIYHGAGTPITRIGLQRTFVFYKDGVETFVIRPGFSGKVEDFGMLIPFPNPPAVRKVSDNIFDQVANAIDPPEVNVYLNYNKYHWAMDGAKRAERKSKGDDESLQVLNEEEVRVVSKEAVGMYEVAVLEAGGAEALKKWLDQHGYQYPEGMDEVTQDYVEASWCFVAVKTAVGPKAGVDPSPGQRDVDASLPQGSSFDGFVQAMGFRFESEKLVVPMRLSAFNAGDLRNVVYLLTDGPKKIRRIPEEYVQRQISGDELYRNVTELLPIRFIGGTPESIKAYPIETLKEQRNPYPKNGAAKEMFAADLHAIASGQLSLPHEEEEKQLLQIGEHFGLRGADIDGLNTLWLAKKSNKRIQESLESLKEMSLTVVDGDFPREVLASENLTFADYHMPRRRNSSSMYDAKLNAPAGNKPGILQIGAIQFDGGSSDSAELTNESQLANAGTIASLLILAFGALLLVRRKNT